MTAADRKKASEKLAGGKCAGCEHGLAIALEKQIYLHWQRTTHITFNESCASAVAASGDVQAKSTIVMAICAGQTGALCLESLLPRRMPLLTREKTQARRRPSFLHYLPSECTTKKCCCILIPVLGRLTNSKHSNAQRSQNPDSQLAVKQFRTWLRGQCKSLWLWRALNELQAECAHRQTAGRWRLSVGWPVKRHSFQLFPLAPSVHSSSMQLAACPINRRRKEDERRRTDGRRPTIGEAAVTLPRFAVRLRSFMLLRSSRRNVRHRSDRSDTPTDDQSDNRKAMADVRTDRRSHRRASVPLVPLHALALALALACRSFRSRAVAADALPLGWPRLGGARLAFSTLR
ncbi:unnamed protein product [Soboliphyme baturini]|uniref:C2H2-type domain-containing protein n=1 Tax=Soboliphyme baturini TaxID=241478 RepID=A0A183IFL2_9BILA|nr:unnamed protein product [Soboliphyme baturini]